MYALIQQGHINLIKSEVKI